MATPTFPRLRTFHLAGRYNAQTGGQLRLVNVAGTFVFLEGTTPPATRYDYVQAPTEAFATGVFTIDGSST